MRGLLALKANRQVFIRHIETIIDQVTNQMTVDRANQITRLNARVIGKTFWHDFTHPSIHFRHWFVSLKNALVFSSATPMASIGATPNMG
jgi:hypothetical protein